MESLEQDGGVQALVEAVNESGRSETVSNLPDLTQKPMEAAL